MNDEMMWEAFVAFLRENLALYVETTSEYTGGMDGSGQMYRDAHKIKLTICGDTISEVYLD